jgi:mannitol/fructose-specific phosphotransferase system IIA component (Ntr-type)
VARMSDYLDRKHIFTDLPLGDRDDVLRWMIERVAGDQGMSPDRVTTVLRAVLRRERMGTTGIGRGIAIPHAKTSAVERPMVAFARLVEPLPYGATDGAPVHSLFLVVSPLEGNDEHVRILQWIAGFARSDYHATVLRNTTEPESLFELFQEFDESA